jgi:uncharacterized coiled-coil DUF342 family protein
MNIEELQKKREELRPKIGEAKRIREKFNEKTKELRNKKYDIVAQIKKYKHEGTRHKDLRDEINRRVAGSKKRRMELNREYKKIQREVETLRKKYLPEEEPLESLNERRDELEFRQMTHQMSKREEAELVEELSKLNKKIKRRKKILEKNPALKEAMDKEMLIKEKGDKEHIRVRELADRAQEEHLKMVECFNKSDELYRELKKIQKEYVLARLDADKFHKKLVSCIKEIREIEEQMESMKKREKVDKIQKERSAIQKKADDVYERFKKGEKLSTEDFMLLQKAGLI